MQYSVNPVNRSKHSHLSAPTLLYTNYMSERDQLRPRSIHSHHDLVEFIYVLRGSGLYEIAGRPYPVNPGDLIIYNSDVLHDETLRTPMPPIYGFGATGIHLNDLPPNCIIPPDVNPVFPSGELSSEFRTLFRLIYEQSSKQTITSMEICQSLFVGLFYMILDLIEASSKTQNAGCASKADQLGQEIQSYISAHALEDISIQSVARQFNISPTYLSRLFKHTTGSSLMQYVIQRRMGEAQTLLLVTDLPITQIAQQVGYSNLSHFVKMFTQNIGISPRTYRKQYGCSTNLDATSHPLTKTP